MKNQFYDGLKWPCIVSKSGNISNFLVTRFIKKSSLTLLGFVFLTLQGLAQIGPGTGGGTDDPGDVCPPSCLNGTLNISTGYDQNSASWQSPLAIESNWTLVSGPASAGLGANPPCFVIPPYMPWPTWHMFPNAQWVSPFQNSSYTTNNCLPAAPFVFEKCFCVCKATTLQLNMELMADDGATVYLDGNPIGTIMAGWHFWLANRLIINMPINVSAGQHCLTVELHNCGGVAMGFAVEGSISGFDLLTPACCINTGSICGTKINDTDCDGAIDPWTDPGLSGWTIQLKDGLGNVIATTVTDANGNYCFTDLPPGVYTVAEVNQAGWTQTYPTAPGTHTFNLHAGDVGTANFGNCQAPPPPCQIFADYNMQIDKCKLTVSAIVPSMPPGYQLVSTVWTFGDGYSSTQLNPVHYYAGPGVYNVCLTVTIFNGEECCSKTFCQRVTITDGCDGDCNFDANIEVDYNDNCEYTFNVDVLYAGLPITNIYWDFGDGTYGSGTPVTHQFPANGTYTVCVYLFSNINGQCCFQKFCIDVDVNCEDSDGGGTSGTKGAEQMQGNLIQSIQLGDKNMVVLDQNVPNPFAENTMIAYSIPEGFRTAQMVFTNADGRVIKTVDIRQAGVGQLNVFADDLSSGVYVYTLVIDGVATESKRMIKN